MTEEEHIATVVMLVDTAETLARDPQTALAAGELVWGAVIHACATIAHRVNWRPRHPRHTREVERLLMQTVTDDASRANVSEGLDITQKRLHNHFYTGQLNAIELDRYIRTGLDFVRRLLQIAERQRSFTGDAPSA